MELRENHLLLRTTPKKFNEICGHEEHISEMENWIERGDMPDLLMYGPWGTGKSASLNILLDTIFGKSRKQNVRTINASDASESNAQFISDVISKDMRIMPTEGHKFRVIVFEEAEEISTKGQRSLKLAMDRHKHVRLVFITNYFGKMDGGIAGRCRKQAFGVPAWIKIFKWISEIYKKEVDTQDNKILEEMEAFCMIGNVPRECLIELDAILYGGATLKTVNILKRAELMANKLFSGKKDKVPKKKMYRALMELYEEFYVEFPNKERELLRFMYYHAKGVYMNSNPVIVGELSKAFALTDVDLIEGATGDIALSSLLWKLCKSFGV